MPRHAWAQKYVAAINTYLVFTDEPNIAETLLSNFTEVAAKGKSPYRRQATTQALFCYFAEVVTKCECPERRRAVVQHLTSLRMQPKLSVLSGFTVSSGYHFWIGHLWSPYP